MSIDEWVRENGAAALEAAQARAGESEVERLREEVRKLKHELFVWNGMHPLRPSTLEEKLRQDLQHFIVERDALRDALRELDSDRRELLAYVDDAKLAMGDHRVTGQPLSEAIRELVERVVSLDNALQARLFEVRAAVVAEREECAKLTEAATGPHSPWAQGMVLLSSGDVARLIRARGGK